LARNVGLEELRAALADQRQHIGLAVVKKLAVLDDRSAMRVQVAMLPDENEIVATMTWEATGPECGFFDLPAANDLVLVAFADGDPDQAFVVKRLTSKEDKIPLKAKDGHLVAIAKAGKKVYVDSDTEVNLRSAMIQLMKLDSEAATEPLVLGEVMLACLEDLYTKLDTLLQTIITGPAAITSAPGQPAPTHPAVISALTPLKAQLQADKSKYVTTESSNVVSQIAFTERGT
jgi:hypothetical protein